MLINTGIKCDTCGKFISYKDLEAGKACHELLWPDNHFAGETYSSECRKCYKKENPTTGELHIAERFDAHT